MDKAEIKKALLSLNHEDDSHWTEDGLPLLESMGIEGLTREILTNMYPAFKRKTAAAEVKVDVKKTSEKEDLEQLLEDLVKEKQVLDNKIVETIKKLDIFVVGEEIESQQSAIQGYIQAQIKIRKEEGELLAQSKATAISSLSIPKK